MDIKDLSSFFCHLYHNPRVPIWSIIINYIQLHCSFFIPWNQCINKNAAHSCARVPIACPRNVNGSNRTCVQLLGTFFSQKSPLWKGQSSTNHQTIQDLSMTTWIQMVSPLNNGFGSVVLRIYKISGLDRFSNVSSVVGEYWNSGFWTAHILRTPL